MKKQGIKERAEQIRQEDRERWAAEDAAEQAKADADAANAAAEEAAPKTSGSNEPDVEAVVRQWLGTYPCSDFARYKALRVLKERGAARKRFLSGNDDSGDAIFTTEPFLEAVERGKAALLPVIREAENEWAAQHTEDTYRRGNAGD